MRVLLVDDHVIFRQGLKFLLSDLAKGLQFAEAGTGAQALAAIAEGAPNLILLDLNMPGTDGLETLRAVLDAAPSVPVAILSGEEDPALIRAAIDAGASGFVSKTSNSDILVAALKLILDGGIYLPASALRGGEPLAAPDTISAGAEQLSERQTAVLLRAIQGQANKVIAAELGIAEGTVKTHLSAAFRILNVNNRTEAVFAAAKLGLKPPS